MTDDKRQEDFAQRLSRIAHERGDAVAPGQDAPKRDVSDFSYDMPGENHPIRNGIIWAIALAVAGAGGYYGWSAVPQDLKSALAALVSSDDSIDDTALLPEDIPQTDTMSDEGPTLASPAVVGAAAESLSLNDVVTQVSLPTENTAIRDIIPIVRNASCELRAPLASEKVSGVRIENALLPAPLSAFSEQQLTDQVLQNIEAITQGDVAPNSAMVLAGQKTSLDVIVTDTSAPLYLVLQNMGPGVIWNLQAAPEVEIAHVAVIGSDFSGVANLPPDTTLEALLVGDFVPPYQYGADDTPRACMIRPWRNPQPDWIGSLKTEAGSLASQNQMYSYAKGYQAYNGWFTATLGVDAATNMITARDAAHVLLGPKPAEPLSYRGLAGQDIRLMEADYLFVGDAAARKDAAAQLHLGLMSVAAGGDISALNPPALERNGQ